MSKIILPNELINHILSFRPIHPNAKILKDITMICKESNRQVSQFMNYTPSFYTWYFHLHNKKIWEK